MTKELVVGLFKNYKEVHEKLYSLIEVYNYRLVGSLPSDTKDLVLTIINADIKVRIKMNELSRVAMEEYGIILH